MRVGFWQRRCLTQVQGCQSTKPPIGQSAFSSSSKKLPEMGRGDKRTTKGKIWRGSHGKTRSKKTNRPHQQVKKEEKKNG